MPKLIGASLIYDSSDFDISWSSDDTEVTFTFADGAHLPSDTESADIPDYLVTLSGVDDGQIKDKSGVTRDKGDDGYFKLTAVHSGKVADVNAGSTANGAKIIQWSYLKGDNQEWLISAP